MCNKKIWSILSALIIFLSTALIPNLLLSILQVSWNVSVLAACICIITLAFLILIRYFLQRIYSFEKQRNDLSGKYKELMIYSINGRAWADAFEQSKWEVVRCTLFIRDYIDGFGEKDRYEAEMNEALELWKHFLRIGRISQLCIYKYDHILDHFYAVFDEALLVTGLNNFSLHDSTGQLPDKQPRRIRADSIENIDLIKKYRENFNSLKEHYHSKKIYDSMDGKPFPNL